GLGESEVFYLTLLDEILHGACNVFDWNFGINAVLIKQIDEVGFEALERGLHNLFDVRGLAAEAASVASDWIEVPGKLWCDDDVLAKGSQGLSDELFVVKRTVGLGGIEEGDAAFDGGAK